MEFKISNFGGWPLVSVTSKEFALMMLQDCKKRGDKPKLAFSMNGQSLSLIESNDEYKRLFLAADYLQADGQSLVFASKFVSDISLPERIATTDFFHDAALISQLEGLRFYFLGASDSDLEKAISNVRLKYPNLKISGFRNGYFSNVDEEKICSDIIESKTDVLWVGLGKPKEQDFCVRNLERLSGVAWIKTCGGLFDFLAEKYPRAPLWMQRSGLEWLFRTCQSPRRLAKRYLITNIHSLYIFSKFFLMKILGR